MVAIIEFFTKLAPLLSGVLAFFEKIRADLERAKEREIGKELERGKINEQIISNEKKARTIEHEIKKSVNDNRNGDLHDSLRNGKF